MITSTLLGRITATPDTLIVELGSSDDTVILRRAGKRYAEGPSPALAAYLRGCLDCLDRFNGDRFTFGILPYPARLEVRALRQRFPALQEVDNEYL